MTFLKIQDSMTDDRKVKRLARELNIPYAQAVGTMALLWLSVQRHVPDGVLSDWDAIDIADFAQFDGDADKLCHALLRWGLLDKTSDGTLQVHDWETHCGLKKSAKKREQARIRQQRRREKLKREAVESEASNAPVTRDSRNVTPGEREREERLSSSTSKPRSVLAAAGEEKQATPSAAQVQLLPSATAQVDLPARLDGAGLRLDEALRLACDLGVKPNLGNKQRAKLVTLCSTTTVTRDEWMLAVEQAVKTEAPQPAPMGLVVSKLEFIRRDAAAAAATPEPVTRDSRDAPRVDAKTAAIARGLQRYANGAGDA